MVKYKIIFDRNTCIGAFNCINISPKYWEKADDGKVNLKEAKLNEETRKYELIADDENFEINFEAGEACPSGSIAAIKILEDTKKDDWPETAIYYSPSDWRQDPKGYFLIDIDRGKKEIQVAFLSNDHKKIGKIVGKEPREIYYTILKQGWITYLEHAAYLGQELEKAHRALKTGEEYMQA